MKKSTKKLGLFLIISLLLCVCLSSCGSAKGFKWTVNQEEKIITVEGIGKLPQINENKYPDSKYADYTLVFGDGITGVSNSFRFGNRVVIGRSMNNLSSLITTDWAYEVSEDNPFYASYNDALYTKDFAELLAYPKTKAPNDFYPGLQKIGNHAFYGYCGPDGEGGTAETVIIPWGVTQLGNSIIDAPSTNIKFVIPDTVTSAGNISYEDKQKGFYPIWIPSRNNETLWEEWKYYQGIYTTYIDGAYEKLEHVPVSNIASYYGIQSNSLKTFENGKTYYFDQYYKMAKGWTKVNGKWYFFNDYGAAAVKTWLEKDGKSYYAQEDGSIATDRWVEWYNKFYYVGSDGAKYINTTTPDGYKVDSEGARIG